nr:MAG TPA_asm: hypothetical protein [Caudoviricetes sp.]
MDTLFLWIIYISILSFIILTNQSSYKSLFIK